MEVNNRMKVIIAKQEHLDEILKIKQEAHALNVLHRPDVYKMSEILYTDDFIQGYFDDKDKLILLTEFDEEIAAYFLLQIVDVDLPMMTSRKYIYIHDLAVMEKYRKKGIASEMLNYIEGYAREIGATKIELAVHLFNKDALNLYEKAGFRPRAIRMEKEVL